MHQLLLLIIYYWRWDFNRRCLTKSNIPTLNKVTNLHISYTLGPQLRNLSSDFTLGNCLFESAKLIENVDLDQYQYTCFSIGFDFRSEFLFTDGSYGKKIIIFRGDMSSSVHIDNKGKYILISGEGPM